VGSLRFWIRAGILSYGNKTIVDGGQPKEASPDGDDDAMLSTGDAAEDAHPTLGQDEMSDASQTFSAVGNDAAFGRNYAVRGDAAPEFRMPPGWWLVPAVIGGATGWIALISAVFF
jgi:hypothetical protein